MVAAMTAPLLRLFALPLAATLSLAACGGEPAPSDAVSLDDELIAGANGTDPLLAAAVQDPIMSDPQLSTRSNVDSIRPPAQPYAAPIPSIDVAAMPDAKDGTLQSAPKATSPCRQCAVARDAITLAALAARQSDVWMKACAPSLRYAAGWANRLPADLPLYGGARVIEAAGTDTPTCQLRAVTFATTQPVDHMLDWYATQGAKAGYAAAHQADGSDHVLSGSRSRDGTAYIAFVRPGVRGGSEIDLLVNTGR